MLGLHAVFRGCRDAITCHLLCITHISQAFSLVLHIALERLLVMQSKDLAVSWPHARLRQFNEVL